MRLRQLVPNRTFFGYLLYTMAVLLLMLWLQFPEAAVKAKAEAELNQLLPAFAWQIGGISLTLPADIRFSQISISEKGSKKLLFTVESISLRPDLAGWQKTGKWSVRYAVRLLDGGISGNLGLTKDKSGLQYSGEVSGIRLDSPGLTKVLAAYNRKISGTLSANFAGRQDRRQGLFAVLEGNVRVSKGAVSLQEPVLGMDELAFEAISSKVSKQGVNLRLQDGALESKLLAAEFAGSLRLMEPVFRSPVQLQGALLPRPEFLASLGSPMLVNMLKRQLRQDKMTFTLNGTVQEPGIIFKGLPPDFNRLLRDKAKKP
jgi:type II secretion system protein N